MVNLCFDSSEAKTVITKYVQIFLDSPELNVTPLVELLCSISDVPNVEQFNLLTSQSSLKDLLDRPDRMELIIALLTRWKKTSDGAELWDRAITEILSHATELRNVAMRRLIDAVITWSKKLSVKWILTLEQISRIKPSFDLCNQTLDAYVARSDTPHDIITLISRSSTRFVSDDVARAQMSEAALLLKAFYDASLVKTSNVNTEAISSIIKTISFLRDSESIAGNWSKILVIAQVHPNLANTHPDSLGQIEELKTLCKECWDMRKANTSVESSEFKEILQELSTGVVDTENILRYISGIESVR
jgi:hypothetical protein